eukprot:6109612-Amphidinium_carterae.1
MLGRSQIEAARLRRGAVVQWVAHHQRFQQGLIPGLVRLQSPRGACAQPAPCGAVAVALVPPVSPCATTAGLRVRVTARAPELPLAIM